MTFRPDLRLALMLALVPLAGCGPADVEQNGIDRLRAQIARGDTTATRLTLEQLAEDGVPQAEYAAYAGEAALARSDLAEARNWLGGGVFSPATAGLGFRLLARLELREGNLDGGVEALERSREAAPDDPELWVDIGRLRYRLGNHLAALEAADRAIELGPNNVEALRFKGQLARDGEGMLPAAGWFAKAREIAPMDVELRLEHAAALLDAGEIPQAIDLLYEIEIELPSAYYLKAVAAARSGAYGAAREALDRSGPVRSRSAAASLLSAIIDVERGALESAAQTLDLLAREQPDNRRVHELLAYVLLHNGAEEELVFRYADKARGPLGSVWMRTLVGRAYEALDRRVEAAEFLDHAASTEPTLDLIPEAGNRGTSTLARRDEIRARLGGGDAAGGVQAARRFAEDFSGSSDASALLGDALLSSGDKVRARDAYDRAARVRRTWPLVLRMAATMDREAAAKLIAEYSAANPLNPEAAALAADAMAASGDWRAAEGSLDRALKNGMRDVPWALAARSVVAGQLGEDEGRGQLAWAIEAHETQRMSAPAIAALLDALPPGETALRGELEAKLRAAAAR